MSIQSTVNQTFSLLALATSGSRARRKEIDTLKKNISTLEQTATPRWEDIKEKEMADLPADFTIKDEIALNKKHIEAQERGMPAFEAEARARQRLFELDPTKENYENYLEAKQALTNEQRYLSHNLRMDKKLNEDQMAEINRVAFRERETRRLRFGNYDIDAILTQKPINKEDE